MLRCVLRRSYNSEFVESNGKSDKNLKLEWAVLVVFPLKDYGKVFRSTKVFPLNTFFASLSVFFVQTKKSSAYGKNQCIQANRVTTGLRPPPVSHGAIRNGVNTTTLTSGTQYTQLNGMQNLRTTVATPLNLSNPVAQPPQKYHVAFISFFSLTN